MDIFGFGFEPGGPEALGCLGGVVVGTDLLRPATQEPEVAGL